MHCCLMFFTSHSSVFFFFSPLLYLPFHYFLSSSIPHLLSSPLLSPLSPSLPVFLVGYIAFFPSLPFPLSPSLLPSLTQDIALLAPTLGSSYVAGQSPCFEGGAAVTSTLSTALRVTAVLRPHRVLPVLTSVCSAGGQLSWCLASARWNL